MGKEDIRSEWKRDMYHNYLIFNGRGEERASFQEKMLEHNKIEGILSFQVHSIDNHKQFHYEVTGYQAISCISEKVPLRLSQVTMLLNHLLAVLKDAKSYLLDTKDFVLLPEYTFIHLPDYKLGLCYYPGYHVPLQEQLVAFLEFLMGSVDYQDKEAVLFVYSLYMKSKEDSITIQELKSFMEELEVKDKSDTLYMENGLESQGKLDKVKEPQSNREPYQSKNTIKQPSNFNKHNEEKKNQKLKESLANPSRRNLLQYKVTSLLADTKERILGKENENGASKKYGNQKKETKKEHKYPFVKEKLEQEEEILYYPFFCYALFAVLFIVCIGIFLYTYQKGFLYQSLKKKIDGLKLISLLSVMGVILGYGYLKIFAKERKLSRIITRTTYQMPDKEDLFSNSVSSEDNSLIENSYRIHKQDNNLNFNNLSNFTWENNESPMIYGEDSSSDYSGESYGSGEAYHSGESYDEEECTILLTCPDKEYDTLIPLESTKYDTIEIKEYPFYIGTAKNNLGYSLINTAVSRYHAKLEKDESRFILTDLDSTNGTFVNGRKLMPNENFEIKQGDTVSFANIGFIFHCLNK
ncbi:DUF6382 domain-containing protein [Lachnoclostridium phytofermentans]|uniref:FHA domain containing protein n=1 Tax=Lachnoclostridium phytofermentans (strain ATCC 700394 / DSM 18823 / ISDg) TaxID=357809 RepID=A9KQC1_LACP7|nr:DUF6382 domain-containing protein [Lachnoclostridium phytofermentans]ABX40430.1 FHA domain containing protein [Lachnoclostridium phytofermentans ISDg]